MRLTVLFVLSLIVSTRLAAQIVWLDQFAAGTTVTATNAWQGDVSHFQVTSAGQLQLNAPTGGTSTLALPFTTTDSLQYSAWFKMDFAPSATNLLQFWLSASSATLATADGYYLEMGENGSLDAIKLMKRTGGVATLVAAGTSGALANQPAQAWFTMRRVEPGVFELAANYAGTSSLVTQFTVTDTDLNVAGVRYAGIYCLYSDTRKDKYFFDDISLERLRPDLSPPVAMSAQILDANTVQLSVNEQVILTNTIRCEAMPGALFTPDIDIAPGGSGYLANFSTPFVSGTDYTFKLLTAADISGNIADTLIFQASYLAYEIPTSGDVIFNEILPDPSPSVGLPDYEYYEILNRSNKYIRGEEITLRDGTSEGIKLTGVILAPQQIHVLVGTGNGANLPAGIKYTALSSLPTLNNDGETLTMLNQSGEVLDQINYDLNWYKDAAKTDGGYALERVNPLLPCSDAANWKASTAPIGGTPGSRNSVYNDTPDTAAPSLVSAQLTSPQVLVVTLSEAAAATSALDPDAWAIAPAGVQVTGVTALGQATYALQLAPAPVGGVVYTVTAPGITDCSGNPIVAASKQSFGVTQTPESQDISINEFLFNPRSGGSRFVELVNTSDKLIDLSRCRFLGGPTNDTEQLVAITAPVILLPDSLVVLTTDVQNIINEYAPPRPDLLYKNSLPTLPDDEGVLALQCVIGTQVITIDSVAYLDDWHSPFLTGTSREGVSLEKLAPGLPSVLASSWTSAAQPNYGSPTGTNTQRTSTNAPGAGLLTLPSNRVSPDGDGYEDWLAVEYNLPNGGWLGSLSVYDYAGNLRKTVANVELFGNTGLLRWDGDNDEGNIERPGIYMLLLELVNPQGEVFREKHVVVLAMKL